MNELERLRREVCDANVALATSGLAPLTWGNASGITADRTRIAIKPSGVAYERLRPRDIVIVDADGAVVEGSLRPSTDTPTHCVLYRAWPSLGGVVHSHSLYATMFAQARREIPIFGTTHADHFASDVPVTRQLTRDEVERGYEHATGVAIVERFGRLNHESVPGALVAGHAPFAWGHSVAEALDNAIALEAIAHMAFGTLSLSPNPLPLEPHILDKHRARKHGHAAYYGQRPLP
ncbi:MAG: L-ribulose-5-phosphate 4-epimerase AraD [Phycisphaerae bacterium]|nr:L-ribulose-5-phosphate 4-epimerase AraD [Phycisphaerae bacterium]